MKSKKADISSEVVLVIPKIIFMIVLIFAYVLLIKTLLVTTIDIKELEAEIFNKRILYSADGFTFKDPVSDRIHSGTVDLKKFRELKTLDTNQQNLLDRVAIFYGVDNPIVAAKITLHHSKQQETIFYNKVRYDRWEPRALPNVKGGSGSVREFTFINYVLVRAEDNVEPAMLEVKVLI